MYRKIRKSYLLFFLILTGLLFFRFVLAQDFGMDEVSSGLDGSLSNEDPRSIVARIINFGLGFLGVIAVGLIIYAGFLWMTSGGDEEKVSKAKKTLTSAVIGLAIILASWGIATFLINSLSDATNGNSGAVVCEEGASISCGCGGIKVCANNSWSGCVGSDCSGGGTTPTTCSTGFGGVCQPSDDICAPSDFCADDCTCQPRGSIGDSCDGDPDTATCDANASLCGEYLTCDSNSCTCTGPPVITGISPVGGFCDENINKSCQTDTDCATTCNTTNPNGARGSFITITGNNFGQYFEGISQVIFSDNEIGRSPMEVNPVCVNFWTDTQIIIAIPNGVTDGPIKVVRFDNAEDTTDNDFGPRLADFVHNRIVRPGLCAITPEVGALGAEFSYQGINLYAVDAYFGNYTSNVEALSSDFSHLSGLSGQANMPNINSGEADSFVMNLQSGIPQYSNFIRVEREASENDGAYIVSFSPTEGKAGQYVTINGSGFGSMKGDSRVYFGDREASYAFPAICATSVWSDNQIVVKVPDDAVSGNHYIRIDIGEDSIDTRELNPNIFRVDDSLSLKTSICKLEPEQGTLATPVRVYGEYFGDEGREGQVRFYNNKNTSGTILKEGGADILPVFVADGSITGPVAVVKNNQWGNTLNFSVSSCKVDDDCPGQVCCPANTYKSGRCVDSLMNCLIDIPTSVFEWNFSTGYSSGGVIDSSESCSTLASYYGACQTGVTCPNAAGVCSPYSGGGKQVVGECDYSCNTVEGCSGGLGSSTCSYDENINKCIKDGSSGMCSLPQSQTFTIIDEEYELDLTCNSDGNWQTTTATSCPNNWERGLDNICIDKNSSCDVCEEAFACQKVGTEGRCVSQSICPSGSTCEDNPNVDEVDSCIILDDASCDCCCRIGNSAQDCCAPLECGNTCGSDTSDDDAGFGVCSGCAGVGDTQAENDAACNCSSNSGQFCAISNDIPEGYCTDCSSLKDKESCDAHSNVCCFDERLGKCRGGSGIEISNNTNHPDYGYCAYYNCDESDPLTCNSSTPVKKGYYKSVYACEDGCAAGEGDYCSLFNGDKDACTQTSYCCYDFSTNDCKSGKQISSGDDLGYCAYYSCSLTDSSVCESEPATTGTFTGLSACDSGCNNASGGSGKNCTSDLTVSECNFDLCNYPSMQCLTEAGNEPSSVSDCGACCCNPEDENACKINEDSPLFCMANVGNCSGASRGLCCGCSQDSECGNASSVGCGLDTCCEARPEVINSLPESGADKVCRNAVINVTFDQVINSLTLADNILLLEEMEYGSGVCPSGSFAYENDRIKEVKGIAKLFRNIRSSITHLFNKTFQVNQSAIADLPDPNKLYCASKVSVATENSQNQTVVTISPSKLLAPDANYFVVIKGDEELNSQTGIVSASGIGMNGEGLTISGTSNEGEYLNFNNNTYKNSHIIQFRTLSDKESNSGVCVIDDVKLRPSSHLFNTTENSVDEVDETWRDVTFDTINDRDKVFSAWAYSGNQIIQPVTGYFWVWDFEIIDDDVIEIIPVLGLSANKVFARTKTGVTDAETKLKASVNMQRFLGGTANDNPTCTCSDNVCSSNCLNAFSVGDNTANTANVYIFICNNPWPPIDNNGEWSPWTDNCQTVVDGNCTDFNYKFYYCRDAGGEGTFDDLPAISNQAVIRGESAILACSSDGSPCNLVNTSCGDDRNGDGGPDGICIWSVLKESYFFREKVLSPGEITSILDTKVGGEALVTWKAESDEVASFKLYYGEEGKAISSYREINKEQADCQEQNQELICKARISNLENDKSYAFRVSVISENDSESILSSTKTITVTDQTAPLIPTGLDYEIIINEEESVVRFTWINNDSDALFYRLYRGISSGLYGESYDTGANKSSISLELNSLTIGNNYFSVSALDSYNNESRKSNEVIVVREEPVEEEENE